MKKLFLIIALAFIAFHFADAQEIKLVADKTYGVGNDWDKVFDSYYDKLDDCFKIGLRKRLVMYDDGKAIVSHATRNRYSVFDGVVDVVPVVVAVGATHAVKANVSGASSASNFFTMLSLGKINT